MSLSNWFFNTFILPRRAELGSRRLGEKLAGKWVFVSLDDEMDAELLRICSNSDSSYETNIRVCIEGFAEDQVLRLRSSGPKFDEICAETKEVIGDASLHWNDDENSLVMQVAAINADPDQWLRMSRDVLPQFVAEALEFELEDVSSSVECLLRTTQVGSSKS